MPRGSAGTSLINAIILFCVISSAYSQDFSYFYTNQPYPPSDWGEHTVSLRPGDKTILVPGMTLHFMPGIWLENYGFECSEPVLVTENGCDKFIDFSQKLFVKS